MRITRFGQGGIVAAGVSVAAVAVLAATGSAGATQRAAATDHPIYAFDKNGSCYSTNPATTECAGQRGDVSIATGDSVTWTISPANVTTVHNAAGANDVPADPQWKNYATEFTSDGSFTRTFNQPGTYQFVCNAHASMEGTITVTGDPVETPTPTPTSTATPTPTPSASPTPTPQPGGTGTTPPPSPTPDNVKPAVQRLKLKALRHAARVRFTLSENATVRVRVRKGKRVIKSVRFATHAGTRTVTVRSRKLKKGRYTIEIVARDASGNLSLAVRKSFRIRR
jgi:plastocyanin